MDLPQAASAAPVTSVGPASFYSPDQLYQQQQQQHQHQQAQQQAQLQLQHQHQLQYQQQQQQHAQQYYQISHQQQQQQQQQHFQQAGQYGIPAANGAVPLAGNVQDSTAFSKNQINPISSSSGTFGTSMAPYPQQLNAVTTAVTMPHGSMMNVAAATGNPASYPFSSFPSQTPMQAPPMGYPNQSPQLNVQSHPQQPQQFQQPHHQVQQVQYPQYSQQQPQIQQQPQQQPQQPQQQQQQQQQQQPMAAPPVPIQMSGVSPNKPPGPQIPNSPGSQQRERERVTLLLEINKELLQETVNLQAQGKGGSVGQQRPRQQSPAGGDDNSKEGDMSKPASKEFFDCMIRLQANLAYLAQSHERPNKQAQTVPPGPAIMEPPYNSPPWTAMYERLRSLFPGWRGQKIKMLPGVATSPT